MTQFTFPTLSLVNSYFHINGNSMHSGVQSFFWHGNSSSAINFFPVPFSNQSLIAPNPNYQIMGIDVPVLIKDDKTEKSKGTIVILAQDPLRNIKEFQQGRFIIANNIIVGLPFAVQANLGGGTAVWHGIIEGLLQKGYSVYLTDVHKFYAGTTNPQGKQKSAYKSNSNQKMCERQLLSAEINALNPVCVAAFGRTAQSEVAKVPYVNCGIINLEHLSGRNRNWSSIKTQQGWASASNDNKVRYLLKQIP